MKIFPSNNEVGNAWTAHILADLFDSWPAKRDLDWMRTSSQTGVSPQNDEEEMFDGLVDWLKSEGYVRVGQEGDEGSFYNVALTEKGFAVLGSKPGALEDTFAKKLKDAAKSAGTEAGKATLSNLITSVFAIGTTMYLQSKGIAS